MQRKGAVGEDNSGKGQRRKGGRGAEARDSVAGERGGEGWSEEEEEGGRGLLGTRMTDDLSVLGLCKLSVIVGNNKKEQT